MDRRKIPGTDFLLGNQNPDGGWGYFPRQASAVEPTCAALLALRDNSTASDSCRRAIDWLCQSQHADGGWGFRGDDPESAWPTSWAVLALQRFGIPEPTLARGIHWLLQVKTLQLAEETRRVGKKILTIDLSLRGWPWLPGEAAWVEPTALALMALESASSGEAAARKEEGLRFIQDRRCGGGGWNVGSPVMFASPLPGSAHPTAWVLLALARMKPGMIRPEDTRFLRAEIQRDGGILALAWGLLALRTLGEEDVSAESRLKAMQGEDGGWGGNVYQTAVAFMARRGFL